MLILKTNPESMLQKTLLLCIASNTQTIIGLNDFVHMTLRKFPVFVILNAPTDRLLIRHLTFCYELS